MDLLLKLPVSPQRTYSFVPTVFLIVFACLVIPRCQKYAVMSLTALEDYVHNSEGFPEE